VEGEVVIKPVLESHIEIFEGEIFQKTVRDAITGVALSNNTITRRIKSRGKDLREQIYEDFCSSPYTALAIDKSTDIMSEAQLLVYGKFACGCHLVEEFSSVYLCILTKHKILYQEYRDRKRPPQLSFTSLPTQVHAKQQNTNETP